MLAEMY